MKPLLARLLLPSLLVLVTPEGVDAQAAHRSTKRDETPFVFAGIKYGASIDEATKRFGRPARSESVVASEKLYWASDQLAVSFNKKTQRINGFTSVRRVVQAIGQNGIAHSLRVGCAVGKPDAAGETLR